MDKLLTLLTDDELEKYNSLIENLIKSECCIEQNSITLRLTILKWRANTRLNSIVSLCLGNK